MNAETRTLPPLTRAELLDDMTLEQLQTFDTELLSAIALREVDVHLLARRTLAARGLNSRGKWVGFDRAREQMANWCA